MPQASGASSHIRVDGIQMTWFTEYINVFFWETQVPESTDTVFLASHRLLKPLPAVALTRAHSPTQASPTQCFEWPLIETCLFLTISLSLWRHPVQGDTVQCVDTLLTPPPPRKGQVEDGAVALMSFLSSKFPESQPPGDSFAVMRGAREEGASAVPGSGGQLESDRGLCVYPES